MATYVMLFHFTEHGFSDIKDSPKRIKEAKQIVTDAGGRVLNLFLMLGRYDVMWLIEAPSDEVIARISLQFSSKGSTRAETLRAFTESEYMDILNKV